MSDKKQLVSDTVNHYSRDGFVGTGAHTTRPHYVPSYSKIEGDYAPYRLEFSSQNGKVHDPQSRDPSIPLLSGDGVVVSILRAPEPVPVTVKNVTSDEVHYLVAGSGTLKSDFGSFDCQAGDFILVPRAAGYRYTEVNIPIESIVVSTAGELSVDPFPPRGVLNMGSAVTEPKIGDMALQTGNIFETVFKHLGGTTSHFYDFDPLDIETIAGSSPVKKFSIHDVLTLNVSEGGITPPRLINDNSGQTLFFHLGSRQSDRPPIHVNADYDELIVYASGPGSYGSMDVPGTIAWVPKGIPHHGAEENTAEPYQAWLVETRASLQLTAEGRSIAKLMETGVYGLKDG